MGRKMSARFGRIPVAQQRSGLSRRMLYEIAAEHPGLFRKAGSATIVDLEMLDDVLSELPPALIGDQPKEEEKTA
jgi:hypothetical protein